MRGACAPVRPADGAARRADRAATLVRVLTVAVLGRVVVRRDGVAAAGADRAHHGAAGAARARRRPPGACGAARRGPLARRGARANTLQAKVSQLRRALGDPARVPGGPAGYALVADAVDALDALRLAAEGAARLADGRPRRRGHRLPGGPAALRHRGAARRGRRRLGGAAPGAAERGAAAADRGRARRAARARGGGRAGRASWRRWSRSTRCARGCGRCWSRRCTGRGASPTRWPRTAASPGCWPTSWASTRARSWPALEHQVLAHDPALGGPPPRQPARAHHRARRPRRRAGRGARGARRAPARHARRARRGGQDPPRRRGRPRDARRPTAPGWSGWRACGPPTELPTALAEAAARARTGIAGLRGADAPARPRQLRAPGRRRRRRWSTHVLDAAPRGAGARHQPAAARRRRRAGLPVGSAGRRRRRRPVRRARPPAPSAHRRRTSCRSAARSTASRSRSSWPPPARGCSACPRSAQRLDDRFALLADPTAARPRAPPHPRRGAGLELRPALPRRPARAVGARGVPRRGVAGRGSSTCSPRWTCPRAAALDVVERLVDRSLVLVDAHPTGTRYRLLDGVRAFARERADTAADATLRSSTGSRAWRRPSPPGCADRSRPRLVAVTAAERATIDAALALAGATPTGAAAEGDGLPGAQLGGSATAAAASPPVSPPTAMACPVRSSAAPRPPPRASPPALPPTSPSASAGRGCCSTTPARPPGCARSPTGPTRGCS